jgi:protein-S-isoprenylcysteine O-methyltransferase Ste14
VFLRALIAFIALPGVVALAIPALLGFRKYGVDGQLVSVGLLPLGVGLALLLWCVREFYVSGKGTLAPWSPPKQLVTTGLYRYSRNPMYVAVAMMLAGWAVLFWSAGLAAYGLGVLVGFQLRIVFGEEPFLARTHGEHWRQYAARVPRWLWMR